MNRLIAASFCLFLLAGTGCRLVQTALQAPSQTVRAVTPGKKDKNAIDPVELQQTLLRFADEFSTRLTLGVETLRRRHQRLGSG